MHNLQRKLKITDEEGFVKIERLEDDINQRKEMLKVLNTKARRMNEMLLHTKKFKDKAVSELTNYSSRYHHLILVHIVLIQRWFRGVRQRMFFKNLIRRDI